MCVILDLQTNAHQVQTRSFQPGGGGGGAEPRPLEMVFVITKNLQFL
jgi:hypothetical protein